MKYVNDVNITVNCLFHNLRRISFTFGRMCALCSVGLLYLCALMVVNVNFQFFDVPSLSFCRFIRIQNKLSYYARFRFNKWNKCKWFFFYFSLQLHCESNANAATEEEGENGRETASNRKCSRVLRTHRSVMSDMKRRTNPDRMAFWVTKQ